MAAESTHTHQVDVTSDLLDLGIALHHPNFLVLAERARAAAFEELGSPVDVMLSSGFALLVRSISIEYLKPIFAGARVAIVSTLRAVSESALDVEQRFFLRRAGEGEPSVGSPVCELRARLVGANFIERRVAALPRALSHRLSTGAPPASLQAAS